MIKEIFDITKLIGALITGGDDKKKKQFEQSAQLFAHLADKTNSIAKMASKRIYNYPVVVTNAFGDDVETAFKIVKYAESLFAYFLIMSIGMEPVLEKGEISLYLGKFAAEDMDRLRNEGIELKIDLNKSGAYTSIPQSIEETLYKESCKEYASPSIKKWDRFDSTKDFLSLSLIKKESYSQEANNQDPFLNLSLLNSNAGNQTSTGNTNGNNSTAYVGGPMIPATNANQKGAPLEDLRSIKNEFAKSIEQRMNKSIPTAITINLYINEHSIPMTLGVKAIPHFIDSDEMQGIFKRLVDDGKLLSKIIRLRSGEISFFKDFLLGWDQIKSDQEFFQKVGRHSWYRKLLDRKLNSKYKGLLGLKASIKQFLKEQNILPTVTLVTTVNEISDAISYPYLEAVRKNKITKIVDSLMLLALIVYDPDRDLIHCHFNGISHPYIIPIKDLKSDKESDTVKLVEAMSKLMMKSY